MPLFRFPLFAPVLAAFRSGFPRRLTRAVVALSVVGLCAATMTTLQASAPLPLLRVSENHRFLVKQDGTPFFWLGDTAWELFHRLSKPEAEQYLRTRAEQGFTVVQAVALAELEGLTAPTPEGQLPLINNDPTRPNEAYFAHVDWVVDKAASLGLYIALLPTWGDKWNLAWGKGPVVFNATNAESYGEWIGRRYAGRNVIWILGGDRPVENDEQRQIITAMARGLRRGSGGNQLIGFHPPGGRSSADLFQDESWLDFNMRQNGHEVEYGERYARTRVDYDRTPAKPVVDGEPIYEDHPISFKAAAHGHSTAADVRRPLYWDLFNGAFGHTYGHHSVWQMFAAGRVPINAPLMSWQEALQQPGARQMQYARWLLESRPFLSRVPADDVIVPDTVRTSVPGEGRYRFVATKDSGGAYAMVYVPVERRFRVNLAVIHGPKVRAWWYNPRNGEASPAGEFTNQGEQEFLPPHPGEGLDWVLVLDDEARGFSPPGQHGSAQKTGAAH